MDGLLENGAGSGLAFDPELQLQRRLRTGPRAGIDFEDAFACRGFILGKAQGALHIGFPQRAIQPYEPPCASAGFPNDNAESPKVNRQGQWRGCRDGKVPSAHDFHRQVKTTFRGDAHDSGVGSSDGAGVRGIEAVRAIWPRNQSVSRRQSHWGAMLRVIGSD
jgi:hypothetical protein